ncbi:KPN_02809 family neutral zinc metallopeptidase [Cryptosporangium arvum]|uniref:KPN_02809 family neutral zinc metallopeptidase n=1 Tax=Cryptosporangium arvum TaxID=80871 RepID=UPI0004B096EE|nr:neutral zinc metallopeptidase [Cryptosporangium arvum]
MDFDDDANLDLSKVEDGRGGGGGFGGPMVVGGGALGLIVTVVLALLGYNTLGSDSSSPAPSGSANLAQECAATNEKRFDLVQCRQVAVFDDLRDYWGTDGAPALNAKYSDPTLRFFTQGVNTACGQATSAVGPFYCPGDQRIYIDLGFYDELAKRFGAPGEFAQAYVLAHEFGHHVQYLTGFEGEVRKLQQQNPGKANQYSIALELQADCYAGVWTANATGGAQSLVEGVSQEDIKSALGAAGAVGDDRIQEQSGGQVNPETWTHGSAAQREQWFDVGRNSGDPQSCTTLKRA